MTRANVRAQQANQPDTGARMIRVIIRAVHDRTVTVELPGGGTIDAPRVSGCLYAVGAIAYAITQEPAVGPVLPIG